MNARTLAWSLATAVLSIAVASPSSALAQYSPTGEPPAAPDEIAAPVPAPQIATTPDATAGAPSDASGQWVYTQQYGWIWMPYAEAYTSVPADGYGQPYQYVYYPAYQAWTWVVAPWVWGIGAWPHFGVYGPARFAWYGHGWWRTPARWHYAPRPYYGGHAFHAVAPAPGYRGGYAPRASAFAPRGVYAPRAPVYGPGRGGFAPRAAVAPARSGFVSRGPAGGQSFGHSAPAARTGGGFGGGHVRAGGGGHGGHR